MKGKHTQGEWKVKDNTISANGRKICGMFYDAEPGDNIRKGVDEKRANAKIIVQSPLMYLFLTTFVEMVESKSKPTTWETAMYASAKGILKLTQ